MAFMLPDEISPVSWKMSRRKDRNSTFESMLTMLLEPGHLPRQQKQPLLPTHTVTVGQRPSITRRLFLFEEQTYFDAPSRSIPLVTMQGTLPVPEEVD